MHDAITDVPGILVGAGGVPRGRHGVHRRTVPRATPWPAWTCGAARRPPGRPTASTRRTSSSGARRGARRRQRLRPGRRPAGVVRYLEERGIGYDVGVRPRADRPGACLIDLTVGDPEVRPDAALGLRACQAASRTLGPGVVGAGRVPRSDRSRRRGTHDEGRQAYRERSRAGESGRRRDRGGESLRRRDRPVDRRDGGRHPEQEPGRARGPINLFTEMGDACDTTIGVVATNARLDKAQARRVAMMGHDGWPRAIVPAHTTFETGDSLFCMATGEVTAQVSASARSPRSWSPGPSSTP